MTEIWCVAIPPVNDQSSDGRKRFPYEMQLDRAGTLLRGQGLTTAPDRGIIFHLVGSSVCSRNSLLFAATARSFGNRIR